MRQKPTTPIGLARAKVISNLDKAMKAAAKAHKILNLAVAELRQTLTLASTKAILVSAAERNKHSKKIQSAQTKFTGCLVTLRVREQEHRRYFMSISRAGRD